MSFHFVSHPWQVQELDDETSMSVALSDLEESTIAVLADELFDLCLAEGRPNLYLNLQDVRLMPNELIGQFASLDARLRDACGRLALQNLNSAVVKSIHAAGLAHCTCAAAVSDG